MFMKREEAIKELRGFIGQLTEGCQEAIKVLIPELSESEDERIRKEIISALKFANDGGVYDKHIAYLEKQVQQPAEWSEEDENKLNHILEIVHIASGREVSVDEKEELESFLKSLRPQPKAKLTLLDENIIKAAVAFIEQNDHFNYWGGIDKHTVIKALRSLKSHWKPSEKQILALRTAVIDCPDDKELLSLYEDLRN